MLRTLFIAWLFGSCAPVYGANHHWKFGIDLKEESVAEGDSKFVVGDWICTVGAAKADKAGAESRRLGCGVGDGLQVYLNPVCYTDKKTKKSRSEGGLLNLQMKNSASKMVSLGCYER